MTFNELVQQIESLSIAERKRLISVIVDSIATTTTQPQRERIPGLHAGSTIWVSDDFDDPLPDSFWLGEE